MKTGPHHHRGPNEKPAATFDAGDMSCGDLVLALRPKLLALQPGEVLRLIALDPGAPTDIPAYCRLTGHRLVLDTHPEYWIERKPDEPPSSARVGKDIP